MAPHGLRSSIRKLWRTRDELSFSQVRLKHIVYFLPLTIILILLDQRNTYFSPQSDFLGQDASLLAYVAYLTGTIVVLLFCMKKQAALYTLTFIAAVGFVFWLALPVGDAKTCAMFIFQFGIGGCAIFATYAHVFVLNNAERLVSIFLVAANYGLFIYLHETGVSGVALSVILPGILLGVLIFCIFSLRKEEYPDTSEKIAVKAPKGAYIVLFCPFAQFTVNVFGEEVVKACETGDDAMRGIGTIAAVLLALIIQVVFRRSVWYMLNLFLFFTLAGILLLALPGAEDYHTLAKTLFGIGDGFGYIMTFYIIGIVKRFYNDKFFWIITFSVMLELLISAIIAGAVAFLWPDALPAVAIAIVFLFIAFFMTLSPTIQRNIFDADWIYDFNLPDIVYEGERNKRAVVLDTFKLSPREKEVAEQILLGLPVKQIAFRLGVRESTVKGYSKTLYRKLDINSRSELFARFAVPERTNGDAP